MTDPNDPRNNAAWRAAQQWQQRARQAKPGGQVSGIKLLFTWLLFGVMMIVGTILGLFFLLIGWAMLPFLRRRMKKRMEQMRADQAQDVGGATYHEARSGQERTQQHQVLEGDYEARDERS
ncbi:hypothetical protein OM427_23880 [Halomonas sp. 18H]|uniref:hypothetical protein n=1 Tax=Halomonas almeriensis TaxID=308163 RepID=UPI0022321719|nr:MULTISPECIES: hypothetical protein [Halomonas]MCW4152560.1 hypothetical protein [Halomonas sp. 18H]MDN3553864.1 hypothetical protein [Halomonas almeriensis]